MNLVELRSVRAVCAAGFSITKAAERVHGSQPGISRHVIEVESELGVPLFIRSRNRLVGLTPAGTAILPLVERVLNDVDDLRRLAGHFASGETGTLTVATSHTHARYLLPGVIKKFIADFPKVDLRLRQGDMNQIAKWVDEGEADVSVAAIPTEPFPEIERYRMGELRRIVVAHRKHPVLRLKSPTLRQLAAWPLITYEREFVAHQDIVGAFKAARIQPRIVLMSGDTDVLKIYAESGLGIAILADQAFDPAIDKNLRSLDVGNLFPSTPIFVGVKRDRLLSIHTLRFISLVAPEVGKRLEETLRAHGVEA